MSVQELWPFYKNELSPMRTEKYIAYIHFKSLKTEAYKIHWINMYNCIYQREGNLIFFRLTYLNKLLKANNEEIYLNILFTLTSSWFKTVSFPILIKHSLSYLLQIIRLSVCLWVCVWPNSSQTKTLILINEVLN